MEHAKTLIGKEASCFKQFAEALEIIPYTLAENAGLSPISVVTELRNRHAKGEKYAGINVRKVNILPMEAFEFLNSSQMMYSFSFSGFCIEYIGWKCTSTFACINKCYKSSCWNSQEHPEDRWYCKFFSIIFSSFVFQGLVYFI